MAGLDDEAEWIRRSREGEAEAIEALVQRYQRMIHAITYRMTGSLDDAEDLAQDALVQAFQSLDRFRGESMFSTWLCQIAVNRCLNWRKARARRAEVMANWALQRELEQELPVSNEAAALSARVQAALLGLSEKHRAAIILTIYEGLNHAEAARVMGCAETTISWRVFSARRKLRHLLQDNDSTQDRA